MNNTLASDNVSTACPEVMDAVVAANHGVATSYGEDAYSLRLKEQFSALFETDVTVYPVVSGTACNALLLATITPSYGKVFCHEMSHINTDECAAPEFFSAGAKLIPLPGDNGKISPDTLLAAIRGVGNVHSAQPSTLSLTESCETGVVYQLDELQALCEVAHAHDLKVHMDGARFSNAIVSLDVTPAQLTWQLGVDVLSFGGTKNGCLAAEAAVFFNHEDVQAFPFLHKRSGHLLSKMRFVSAQLEAYLSNDVWRRNARHANAMAARFSQGLDAIDGVELAFPTQSNEVFAHLSQQAIDSLNKMGFPVTEGELDETAPPRFVAAWNTTDEDVDRLLAAIVQAVSR